MLFAQRQTKLHPDPIRWMGSTPYSGAGTCIELSVVYVVKDKTRWGEDGVMNLIE